MRICIYGAGAVGSHIAAKFLRAGLEPAIVARGPHLAAMRERGLTFRGEKESFTVPTPLATDDPGTLPVQDVVLVTLKTVAWPGQAARLARLAGPQGTVVFLANGIPWWWRATRDGGATLPLLDPAGELWSLVGPARSVGGVIYSPNEIVEPGIVEHTARNLYYLGAPVGDAARSEAVAGLFAQAGIEARVSPDIRREVWRKLLMNAPGNPLSALTRLSAGERAADPELTELSVRIVQEVLAVARAEGADLAGEVDLAEFRKPPGQGRGAGRPSMLQDVIAGRPTEVESILGQVQAFAREHGVPVPAIDVILPLMRGLDRAVRAGAG
ncbi:MAG: 2-dehydropantoate 2-reductase [Alsobacter sp.]